MLFAKSHREFAGSVEGLVGHTLSAIRYFGVDAGEEILLPWLEGDGCHSIDFGLDMVMADGQTFGVTWSGRFWQYGVDVLSLSLATELARFHVEDMTSHPSWVPIIGRTIAAAKVHWSWSGHVGEPKVWFPQDIELAFDDGSRLFLCASELRDDTLTFQQDSISVVFGDTSARRLGVGPYRRE